MVCIGKKPMPLGRPRGFNPLIYGFVVLPRSHLSTPKTTYPHKNPRIYSERWCSRVPLVRGILVAAW